MRLFSRRGCLSGMPDESPEKPFREFGNWHVKVASLSVYPALEAPNGVLERVFDRKVGENWVFLQFIDGLGALA